MTHSGGDRFGFSPADEGWLWWFGVMPVPEGATVGGGRGAGEAIEDGTVLARFLEPASAGDHEAVVSALRRFEAARRVPTAAVQDRSWRYGVTASWTNPLACAARGVLMATTWRRRAEQGRHAEFARLRDAPR